FVAGARSVVVSLWPVDDDAAALLMTRFYQNLLGKRDGLERPMPRAEALREAKDWLRKLTSPEATRQLDMMPQVRGERRRAPAAAPSPTPFAHPYYWSVFVLIGDPE